MGFRGCRDHNGGRGLVWDVYPELTGRRRRSAGPPPDGRERRRYVEPRLNVRSTLSAGWLAFESQDGERRRLAPIPVLPHGWESAPDDELRAWCATAQPAPRARRLIE